MAANAKKRQTDWTGRLEQLEDRLLMSVDPVGGFLGVPLEGHAAIVNPPAIEHHLQQTPDFWIDPVDESTLDGQLRGIETALADAHDQTGLSTVRENYGFLGRGQTVAVIDSGIAYNHLALGGGFGSNYRVVGGWDFTGENDANPYDDGTAGAHGTHVSGILGADGTGGSSNMGVAPEVDLVGLRVFDDSGAGFFSWVENALDWVHANRNQFDNPITAVNLSLGVSGWNADTIPSWAMLEDEFAQLEADGIFIAVSAGNSFTTYDATGLSYPAASSHVVPVMSVDDSGLLSYYSQRSTRAIAAPGRGIVSTVPDYAGNNNGITDDYASFSGTSMASPYVAGASVILREAMEFVGMTSITQDTIYDHMVTTADTFFDSATNQSYQRLNMQAAVDALMPTDDYGSTVSTAYNLGSIGGEMNSFGTITTSGLIGTLSDADYFSFTAASTGTMSFTATGTQSVSPSWNATWDTIGGGGTLSGVHGETYIFDVVAGQAYTLGLSSPDGLGYYDLAIESASTFTYTDWGVVTQSNLAGIGNNGETWYRIEADQTGFLTAEAFFDSAAGDVGLAFFDADLQLVQSGIGAGGWDRVDAYAAAGSEYYLQVTGSNADINFRLTNLVSSLGSTVDVGGTTGDDTFTFAAGVTIDAGSRHVVTVNEVTYEFDTAYTSRIQFDGGAGSDTIVMTGTAGDETATLRVGDATLVGSGFAANTSEIENMIIHSSGGSDTARLYGSEGDDSFYRRVNLSSLSGNGFSNQVHDFNWVEGYATQGGFDRAYFFDSAGDDQFVGKEKFSWMRADGILNYVQGFEQVDAYATLGGNDQASFYDSAGNDEFRGKRDSSWLSGNGFLTRAHGFDQVDAYATQGGNDRAYLFDSSGDDKFYGKQDLSWMSGTGFSNRVHGFDWVEGYATQGGFDRAYFFDSAGDDQFVGKEKFSWMRTDGILNYAQGFDWVEAYATQGGNDQASLYDSAGDDEFASNENFSWVRAGGILNYAQGFERVGAYATLGGNDQATVSNISDSETVYGRDNYLNVVNAFWSLWSYGFDAITAIVANDGTAHDDVASVDYYFEKIGNWA